MSVPPPIPKRPASTPVTRPPSTIKAARRRISLAGTPRIIECWDVSCCGAARLAMRDKRECIAERSNAGTRFNRCAREVAAKSARPRRPTEQAKNVSGDGVQADSTRKLALDIGDERMRRSKRRFEARHGPEQDGIDGQQPPRLLIGD